MHANLKGFSAGGLVGMSLPSLSVAGMGGSAGSPQRVLVEIGVNDDRFNAYVDGRAAPIANQAGARAVQVASRLGARSMPAVQQAQQRLGTTR
ncbi:hypothetical protein D3C86_1385660 [compost metagenome]